MLLKESLDNIMKKFEMFVVLGEDNCVDVYATVENFRAKLEKAVNSEYVYNVDIMNRVDAFLETLMRKDARGNLDYVTGEIARAMGGDEKTYTKFKNQIADYIRENSCGEKDGKPVMTKKDSDTKKNVVVALSSPKKYFLGKGRNGGVDFWENHLARKA